MARTIACLLLLGCLLAATPALADGVFYWTEWIPPAIPYQRAMLWFDGSQETLLVQSKYQATAQEGGRLGWVVPVPAVPELASIDAAVASGWFNAADRVSAPVIIDRRDLLLIWSMMGAPALAGCVLVLCCLPPVVRPIRFLRRHRLALVTGAVPLLLTALDFWTGDHLGCLFWVGPVSAVAMVGVALLSPAAPRLSLAPGDRSIILAFGLLAVVPMALWLQPYAAQNAWPSRAVEVVKEERVGIYDVQVVTADRPTDLIDWLNRNEFRFDESDTQVFDDYLRRGWCFVVAQVDPSGVDQAGAVPEGLVAPLLVRFASPEPVYPLAMAQDLVFAPAADNEPYRKHLLVW